MKPPRARKSTDVPSKGRSKATPRPKRPAKVIRFPALYRAKMEPSPHVIAHCEALLAAAKDGSLRALGYVRIDRDDLSEDGVVDSGFVCVPGMRFAMSHGLLHLQENWVWHIMYDGDRNASRPPPKKA